MIADLLERLLPATDGHSIGLEDVACDFCPNKTYKALISCLGCSASYCEKHAEAVFKSPPFKKQNMVEPSKKLQENICSLHNKVKNIFCHIDKQCVCYLCSVDRYKATVEQRELWLRRKRIHQEIQVLESDVEWLKTNEETLYNNADRVVKNSEKIFNELVLVVGRKEALK